VVQLLATVAAHDATGVELPRGGVDADGDGALGGNSGLEGLLVTVLCGVLPTGDARHDVFAVVLAGAGVAVASSVGVGTGALKASLLKVVERDSGVAALAAVAAGGASSHLLGGQVDEAVTSKGPVGLNSLRGAERPARAALGLVLHGGDHVAAAPVDRRGDGLDVVKVRNLALLDSGLLEVQVDGGELLRGEVHELGDVVDLLLAQKLGLAVPAGDSLHVLLEHGATVLTLRHAVVRLAILLAEVVEGGGAGTSQANNQQGCDKEGGGLHCGRVRGGSV